MVKFCDSMLSLPDLFLNQLTIQEDTACPYQKLYLGSKAC